MKEAILNEEGSLPWTDTNPEPELPLIFSFVAASTTRLYASSSWSTPICVPQNLDSEWVDWFVDPEQIAVDSQASR